MCQTKKNKKEKLVMDSASNSEAALLEQPPLQSQESRNLLRYIDDVFLNFIFYFFKLDLTF